MAISEAVPDNAVTAEALIASEVALLIVLNSAAVDPVASPLAIVIVYAFTSLSDPLGVRRVTN